MRLNSSSSHWYGKPLSPACEHANLLITRHLDGELAEGDARQLRMHLTTCAACRRAMEIQTAQSHELADKLKSLWAPLDSNARKKKFLADGSAPILSWPGAIYLLPRVAACAAFMAGTLYLASTYFAPEDFKDLPAPASKGVVVPSPSRPLQEPAERSDLNVGPKVARPQTAPSETPKTNAPCGLDDAWLAKSEFEEFDVPAQPAEETPPIIAEKISEPAAPAPEAARSEPAPVPSVNLDQTLAALSGGVPLEPIPGVTLKYTLNSPSGAREEGCLTLLGDVLNGKAVVHLETEGGCVLDAAQSEIDTVFDAAHATLAHRLIRECVTLPNRKRIEQAINKLGESGK